MFNDDGRVPWGQLTNREKVARTTQQSFNFSLIAGGAVATIVVFALLYTDVFSPDSKTAHFNSAVNQIKADSRAIELLGDSKDISAFGEASWNKWRRNRPIASRTETDKLGIQRLYMHFNVAGPKNEGTAYLFMLKRPEDSSFHYGQLILDVKGHSRLYLENAGEKEKKKVPGKLFGVRWS